jgi:gentisate 1,2-dioxygenase
MIDQATNQSPVQAQREAFYARAQKFELAPLWRVLHGLVPRHPESPAQPAHWRFSDVRPFLLEAAKLIGTKEAERRVLILENPGLRGESKLTRSLYAGMQIVMPGEIAPSHRHAASALRFVLESKGGYTAVDGEKTFLAPGDFVITPAWKWHEHGNDTDAPIIWLDCLDIHIVNILDCGFREDTHELTHSLSRPIGASTSEATLNMLPMDVDASRRTSPIFNYPYSRTREALDGISRWRASDPAAGFKMRYVNPANGDWAIPTIATWAQLLPAGFQTIPYRSTDGTIFVVVEGNGESTIAGTTFRWGPKDVFVVPSWCEAVHRAASDTVLFGASDRVIQEKLGIWRERVGPSAA